MPSPRQEKLTTPCLGKAPDPFYTQGVNTKTTIATLQQRKADGVPVPVLTCYDFAMARVMAAAGIECILVGDTIGEVVLGHDSTLPVTMDLMVSACGAVRRGAPDAYIIGDMPYLSFQVSHEQAITNSGRLMAEGGCDAVKIECDQRHCDVVAAMARATIPVVAHIGLRPQSIHQAGGYKAQGRNAAQAVELIEQAVALELAGAAMLLLEAVPSEPARIITERSGVPVVGCGAGPHCDAQVVVLYDMLGLTGQTPPRFVKQYAQLQEVLLAAMTEYREDVVNRKFPTSDHSYPMTEQQQQELQQLLRH